MSGPASLRVLNLRFSDRPSQPARSYSEFLRRWSPACEAFLAKRGRLAYVLVVRVLISRYLKGVCENVPIFETEVARVVQGYVSGRSHPTTI